MAVARVNQAKVKKLIEAIEAGNFPLTAARLAGIRQKAIREWIRLGESEPMKHLKEADFAFRYRQALVFAETNLLNVVSKAAATDPNHARWLLERRFRKRWGSATKKEVFGKRLKDIEASKVEINLTLQVREQVLGKLKVMHEKAKQERLVAHVDPTPR